MPSASASASVSASSPYFTVFQLESRVNVSGTVDLWSTSVNHRVPCNTGSYSDCVQSPAARNFAPEENEKLYVHIGMYSALSKYLGLKLSVLAFSASCGSHRIRIACTHPSIHPWMSEMRCHR